MPDLVRPWARFSLLTRILMPALETWRNRPTWDLKLERACQDLAWFISAILARILSGLSPGLVKWQECRDSQTEMQTHERSH